MKKNFLLICTFFSCGLMHAPQTTFRFFIKPYPGGYPLTPKKISSLLDTPSKVVAHAVINAQAQKYLPSVGMTAFYQVMMSISDVDGLVSFPIAQKSPKFTLVATPSIFPVFTATRQVNHMEWDDEDDTAMYGIERLQDKATKLYYWQVKAQKLPTKQRIPESGLVVCSKAKHLYVPEGITVTWEGSEWILPTMYVKKGFNSAKRALDAARVRRFFAPMSSGLKKIKHGYQAHVRRYGGL